MPGGGVEPPRPEGRRILSPLRLPVPPSRLGRLIHCSSGPYCAKRSFPAAVNSDQFLDLQCGILTARSEVSSARDADLVAARHLGRGNRRDRLFGLARQPSLDSRVPSSRWLIRVGPASRGRSQRSTDRERGYACSVHRLMGAVEVQASARRRIREPSPLMRITASG